MDHTVAKLKALGELHRFRIMMMLLERPLCVCEIQCVLKISGSNLSNHLKNLKYADLLESRRDGKWIEYSIKNDKVRTLLDTISQDLNNSSQIEADRQKLGKVNRHMCAV